MSFTIKVFVIYMVQRVKIPFIACRTMRGQDQGLRCQLTTEHITKTCLYNFDHLKPLFYLVKLGFTGVYIIFLISAQKHRFRVLVRRRLSNEYPQSMFWAEIRKIMYTKVNPSFTTCFEQKYEKISEFLSENFQFLVVKFSLYLNRHVFIMISMKSGGLMHRLIWAFIIRICDKKVPFSRWITIIYWIAKR